MRQFRGTFEGTLALGDQLLIPPIFRDRLCGHIVAAASFEFEEGAPRAVGIWETPSYEAFAEAVTAKLNPISAVARQLDHLLNAYAYDTTVDADGQIRIPKPLIEYAVLTADIVIIGAGPCLQLFDRPTYERYLPALLARASALAAGLEEA